MQEVKDRLNRIEQKQDKHISEHATKYVMMEILKLRQFWIWFTIVSVITLIKAYTGNLDMLSNAFSKIGEWL